MLKYEKKVLNALLDSFERSSLYNGESQANRSIIFKFTRQRMPEYFSDSGFEYEDINDQMGHLKEMGLITIDWKNKVSGHIIQAVRLSLENADRAYAYLGRTSKREKQRQLIGRIERLREKFRGSPITESFLTHCLERVRQDKPIKEFVDVASPSLLERLSQAISDTELNGEEFFVREFSIHHYKDSKAYESLIPKVCKVIRHFNEDFKGLKNDEVLARFNIISKPNYIRFKGTGTVSLRDPDSGEESLIYLKPLKQGMAITEKDVDHLNFLDDGAVKNVITIENDTTFFHWHEPDSLIVYLGGFPNHTDVEFLKKVGEQLPEANFLHFGDIDVGGFDILSSLTKKTGLEFEPHFMDIDTLKGYDGYAKSLTPNDIDRLKRLLGDRESEECRILGKAGAIDTLEYMLKTGKKLEQEGVMRN